MAGYNFKKEDEVREYLKNLYIEYQFGCLSEKKPEVCHLLGDYYESVKQNFKEAIKLYKKNCDERNYGRSCAKYGDYRIMGTECERDPVEAFKYMEKGCNQNDGRGCLHAGALALSEEKIDPVRGNQVMLGMKYLKKACDMEIEKACFYLSGVYLNGIEGYVPKNMKEAYTLSLKCCELNNPYACANLSIMHKKGDGVQQSTELAETFKTKADEIMKELRENKKSLKFHQGIEV
ncbi:Sel1 repeat-containing protein 1 like protein [Melipona quadrifasciata]|uniref:Sel1 repeat-containing protein 1 like protein n=1 Tax=Melipona quadrifasciata TaxID=166423 RepID=A0A0M9A984_9HYME|nr:Sel1 repeat-containing protein 1 like protein [Melipona quadrifasciata]